MPNQHGARISVTPSFYRVPIAQAKQRALGSKKTSNEDEPKTLLDGGNNNALTLAALATTAFFYWYWLVLGAAAKANGLPLIPDFLPMTPGWPPSQDDLQGPIDDAYHFFYLSELIGNDDAPYAPPTRLAVYNIAEAWIFAVLPALWKDPQRLPRPALLGLWSILGINLTNAFLAPYLFVTAAVFVDDDDDGAMPVREKNAVVAGAFGSIATAVAGYALYETVTMTTLSDWQDFIGECQRDRTYFAFVVDWVLFSFFQPYILKRAKGGENDSLDFVPFVGLMNFLFRY